MAGDSPAAGGAPGLAGGLEHGLLPALLLPLLLPLLTATLDRETLPTDAPSALTQPMQEEGGLVMPLPPAAAAPPPLPAAAAAAPCSVARAAGGSSDRALLTTACSASASAAWRGKFDAALTGCNEAGEVLRGLQAELQAATQHHDSQALCDDGSSAGRHAAQADVHRSSGGG